VPAGWRSVGARQRVHNVRESAEGGICVRLVLGGAPVESDKYASNVACGARAAGAPAPGLPRSGSAPRGDARAAPLHSRRGADGGAI
jgi:hypothetical protein